MEMKADFLLVSWGRQRCGADRNISLQPATVHTSWGTMLHHAAAHHSQDLLGHVAVKRAAQGMLFGAATCFAPNSPNERYKRAEISESEPNVMPESPFSS